MLISENSVVTLEYRLTNDGGELLDSSDDGLMVYLHGHGQMLPGVEKALEGKKAGERTQFVVAAKDGYGEPSHRGTISVPKTQLPEGFEPEVGMGLDSSGPDGHPMTLWIVGVGINDIQLSTDHPLAGVDLHFDMTVKEVRAATDEELSHGHAHGPGGHH